MKYLSISSLFALLVLSLLSGCRQSTGDDTIVSGDLADRLDAYFSAIEFWGFSGAVLVAENNDVILARGYGFADREAEQPHGPDMVQTVGSIAKQFTGAAILKLESEGKLSVGDRITKYFDEVPSDKSEITIHQLLTHSAGFPGAIGYDFDEISREDYIGAAMEEPLVFAPGTSYEYSNVGFILLAAIVEMVSGESYESFLREELLIPAQAEGIGYVLPNWPEDKLVVGYSEGERWGTLLERSWATDGPYWHLRGNGGIHASANDMYRWFQVVRGETDVLPANAVERWTTGHVDEGYGDSFYGYGWVEHDTPWGKMIAHNGGNMVFAADFFWLVEQDLFFYVSSNSSYWRVPEKRESILSVAFNPDGPIPWYPGGEVQTVLPETPPSQGAYLTESGSRIDLNLDGLRLRLSPVGQQALDMLSGKAPSGSGNFDGLNERSERMLLAIRDGEETPFLGIDVPPDRAEQSAEGIGRFMEMATRNLGSLVQIDVMGTITGTNLADIDMDVAATTWLAARFEDGTRALGVLWDSENGYLGTSIGPEDDLPTWIYAPVDNNQYVGWMPGNEEGSVMLTTIEEAGVSCLLIGNTRACAAP